MKDSSNNIHPSFRLNGISYSAEELNEVAYSLVKEGQDHEIEVGDFLLDWLSASDTLQVSTSGSTGPPKVVRLHKKHMKNSAIATGDYLGLKANDTALLCLPMSYIAGKMMMVRALVLGLDLHYIIPSSSPLKNTAKQFNFAAMVPNQLKNDIGEIERVQKLIVGGAAISETLKNLIIDKANDIYETFGMTETISHIAMRKLSGGHSQKNFKTLNHIAIATDQRKCLLIKAPQIGVEELITNDMVTIVSDAEFNWLGRIDNVVNSGGVKLHPEKIEAKLESFCAGRFFVAGEPDESLGEKLVLVVEGDPEPEQLFAKIRLIEDLEKFEVPRSIHTLPNFVMTSSGKINRKETLKLISA
ncbi:AMP-binding protein [Muriicola sp. Z0-33]|uniref:AMP-binding protein n=1 Tax=Muriicola sp. Z0-33 TaxID=2816957 RepID=UPI002237BBEE|nr:AMP-binding protein [Muriicola sp. Z0-33]MCW5516610.1 AMP-binding protein [Muriicola sp. Z0-33]